MRYQDSDLSTQHTVLGLEDPTMDSVLGHQNSTLGTLIPVLAHQDSIHGTLNSVTGYHDSILGTQDSVLGHRDSILGTQIRHRFRVSHMGWRPDKQYRTYKWPRRVEGAWRLGFLEGHIVRSWW